MGTDPLTPPPDPRRALAQVLWRLWPNWMESKVQAGLRADALLAALSARGLQVAPAPTGSPEVLDQEFVGVPVMEWEALQARLVDLEAAAQALLAWHRTGWPTGAGAALLRLGLVTGP